MSTIPKVCKKTPGEARNFAVDMRGKLDEGENLTGVPTIVEVTSSDLTITNKAISIQELIIEGKTVPQAQAVQFKVAGGLSGHKYKIKITVTTTATPSQTLEENVQLRVL